MSDELTVEEKRAYWVGLREGIRRFAWWKDGEQYVGTCGTTLKKALAEVDAEFGIGS